MRYQHLALPIALIAAFVFPAQAGAERNFRQDMRNFVQQISAQGKAARPGFLIIPQNGQELLTDTGEPDGIVNAPYKAAVDGTGREDLFYGYTDDNVLTPQEDRDYLLGLTELWETNGLEVLVTDYCSTPSFVDDSYAQNDSRGYASFAADDRELRTIPSRPTMPHNVNADDVMSLADVKNFLYLINPSNYATRDAFLNALRATNYDLILIDFFFDGDAPLTAPEVDSLKTKANGGQRLVICYMSIGEAEDYRFYWKPEFDTTPPPWLDVENEDFAGNFKVRYWLAGWQDVILNAQTGYLSLITDAGFDGVYLDLIDAYEFFEANPPPPTAPADLDGSGTVDAVDVQLVINAALGLTGAATDVNNSGTVDAVDVQLVINAALGVG